MFIVPLGAFCTRESALNYGIKNKHKGKAKLEKQKKTETAKAKRERLYWDFPHQLEITKKTFNPFIRLLDKGKPCISCGKHKCGSEVHAGHFKSSASHPELRFDPRNVHGQGSGCNLSKRKRGGYSAETVSKLYEKGLIARFNQELVDWITGPHKPALYTCDDLRALRALFAAETTRLESGQQPSRDWRALPEK